jgi:hypothetical protein
MQSKRTIRAIAIVLVLLTCLMASAPRPALAQQAPPPDASQTKTNPNQPQPTATNPPAVETAALTLTPIRDDGGLLAVAVPPAWSDVAQGEWLLAGAPAGRKLSASPNQADFAANWGTPGVTVYHSTSLPAAMEPEDLLAVFDFSGTCQDGGRGALPPAERSVIYQIWQNCAEAGTAAAVLVIHPTATREFYGVVEVYLAGADDLRALAPLLASVQFGGSAAAAPAGDVAAAEPAPGDTAADAAGEAAPATAAPTLPPPTPTPAPTPAPVFATVTTDRLNLRSGPSTAVDRLTVVTRGMQLTVVGQIDNCAWLRVTAPDGTAGWVSGDPGFTSLGAACETIPVAETP